MKKHITVILVILLPTLGAGFAIFPDTYDAVPYPEGYRKWTHIGTGLVGPANRNFQLAGGFHHIYANDKAMEGYAIGNFPEGSIFVFDVLEGIEKDGNTAAGKRRHIDVMIKDSIKYRSTGGWGFEEFKGDSKTERVLTEARRTDCFNCHQARQKDYIFSDWRE
jgi:hypothetical protein